MSSLEGEIKEHQDRIVVKWNERNAQTEMSSTLEAVESNKDKLHSMNLMRNA